MSFKGVFAILTDEQMQSLSRVSINAGDKIKPVWNHKLTSNLVAFLLFRILFPFLFNFTLQTQTHKKKT